MLRAYARVIEVWLERAAAWKGCCRSRGDRPWQMSVQREEGKVKGDAKLLSPDDWEDSGIRVEVIYTDLRK